MFNRFTSLSKKLSAILLCAAVLGSSAMAATTCSPALERRGAVLRNGLTASGTVFSVTTREVTAVGAQHSHGQSFGTRSVTGEIQVSMPQDQTPFYHYTDHGGFFHASEVGRTPYVYWNGSWCATQLHPDKSPTQVYIYMPRDLTLNFRAGSSPIPNAEFVTTLTHRASSTGKVQKLHKANASGNFLLCPPIGTHGTVSAGGFFQSRPNYPTSYEGYLPQNGTMDVAMVSGGFQHNFVINRSEVDSGGSKTLAVPAATSVYIEKMGTPLKNTAVDIFFNTAGGWVYLNPYDVTTDASGIAKFYIPTDTASHLTQVAIGITENGSTKLYGYYDLSSPKTVNVYHAVEGRPNLISPAASATVNTPITFQWENLSNQNPNHGFYWINIFRNGSLYDEGGFYETSVSGIVYPAGSYQWQVEAYDASGRMYAISDARSFTIAASTASIQDMTPGSDSSSARLTKKSEGVSADLKASKLTGRASEMIRIKTDEIARPRKIELLESEIDASLRDLLNNLESIRKPTEAELIGSQQQEMVETGDCVGCN